MRSALIVASLLVSSTAFAHVTLTYPPPRTASQKQRVCGTLTSVRGINVTTLAPGSAITVTWTETIDHPGHYRISFDADGQDFVTPPIVTPGSTSGMPNVLIDPITDIQGGLPAGGRLYSQQITLPNMECNNCTLQLIQVMSDANKAPYTTDENSNDIYYQCADITLSNAAPDAGVPIDAPGNPAGPDAGTGGGETSGGCSTGGGAGLASIFALAGLLIRRRRR